jgi:hypothetical protein
MKVAVDHAPSLGCICTDSILDFEMVTDELLEAARSTELIQQHLGPQPEADLAPTANTNGAYIAYTFWVTLPDEHAERPLREAFRLLPGYAMQL